MTEDVLRYDHMVEAALRDVVRQSLIAIAKNGLPGEHHFYISFITDFAGVEMPDSLRQQYPDEMTIVLQFQFFNLKIEQDFFSVMLSFNNIREKLVIPFQAVTGFADPSVNFALQFQTLADSETEPSTDSEKPIAKDEKRGEVISLDMFRKK